MATMLPREVYNSFRGNEDLAAIASQFHASLAAAVPTFDAPTSSDSLTNPTLSPPAVAFPSPSPVPAPAPAPTPVAPPPPVAAAPPPPPQVLPPVPVAPLVAPPTMQPAGSAPASSVLDEIAAKFHQTLDFSVRNGGQAPPPPQSPVLTPKSATIAPPSSDVLTNPIANPGSPRTSQFGLGLSYDEALAACGPAAAIALSKRFGGDIPVSAVRQAAIDSGWTSAAGMAGIDSERTLLKKMNVDTTIERTVDWDHVAKDANNGNPVIVSTTGHYFYVDGAKDGKYHVGTSGTDLKQGAEWMTPDQMTSVMGPTSGALYVNNPNTPTPSIASPGSSTQTTAGLSGGGDLSGRVGEAGQAILNAAGNAASWLGEQGQKALQAVLITEGGLNKARGDSGQSAGPLQFYEGGQLANFAAAKGMSLDAAKTYVENNPNEAVQWAIGTKDKPGYLGAAIAAGQAKALSGADLATYAQQHGQVSVSPERAGQNWQSLFGQGQAVASGGQAAAAVSTDPLGQIAADFHTGLDNALNTAGVAKDQVATSLSDIASKFHQGLDDTLKNVVSPTGGPGLQSASGGLPVAPMGLALSGAPGNQPGGTAAAGALVPGQQGPVMDAGQDLGNALPNVSSGLPSATYAGSPVAQQAAGLNPSPFAVKDQAVAGLADTLVPPNTPVASGAARAILDPMNLAFGAGGIPMALSGAAGGEGARSATQALGGDEKVQAVAQIVGALAGSLSPQAVEKLATSGTGEALLALAKSKQSGQAEVNFAAFGLPDLLEKLGKYSEAERAPLEEFVTKQTAAGRDPAKVGDFVQNWIEANPPAGAEAAVPSVAADVAPAVATSQPTPKTLGNLFGGAAGDMGDNILRADLKGATQRLDGLRARYPQMTDEQAAATPLGKQIADIQANLDARTAGEAAPSARPTFEQLPGETDAQWSARVEAPSPPVSRTAPLPADTTTVPPPAGAIPEYQRIAQEAVAKTRADAAARTAAKTEVAPAAESTAAMKASMAPAEVPAPTPDWLETAVADQRAAKAGGEPISAETDLGPAIGQFSDLQTASAKSPPSLGDIAWGVMAEGKKSIFSLSNVHAMNIARGLTTSPAGPGGAAEFAKAYVTAIVKGVQEHPAVTAAVEAATKDGVQFFAHSPETGGAVSGINPLIIKGAQATLGGVSSASSVYTASKAGGASDEDALRNAVIAGGIGAIAGPTLAIRMHDALWKDAVPLAKVLSWSAAKEAGLSGPEAAKFANNLNGGQGLSQIAGSKPLWDIARLIVQSPDWLLSQLKLTGAAAIGAGKTVMDPGSLKSLVGGEMTSTAMTGSQQASRDWVIKQLMVYGFATEALQYGLTGHFTDQNSPGRQFMVEMPTGSSNKSGKSENMTTSLFDGNLQQVLDAVAKHDPGSTLAGKVNPWLATPMELLTNKQYLGGNAPPITSPNETGLAEKWKQAQFVASKFAPIGISSPVQETYAGAPLPAVLGSTLTGLPMSHNTGAPGQASRAVPVPGRMQAPARVQAPARARVQAPARVQVPARAAPLPARR